MQKGIGAAPFAIVAALIVALTVGFWVTQPAHAAAGDVVLAVDDVNDAAGGTSFIDPGDDDSATGPAFGPPGLQVEIRGDTANPLEAAYGKDAANHFRGANDRGAGVEIEATVDDDSTDDDGANDSRLDSPFTIQINLTGEASLSSSSTLTSATCSAQDDGDAHTCQFGVYASGTAGDFTIEGAPGAGDLLTAAAVTKAGSINGQWVDPATQATVLTAGPAESAKGEDDANDPATRFGTISPASFLSGTLPGLEAGEVGFLFQLTDDGGRVALRTETGAATANSDQRNDLRVRIITDAGDALELAPTLSHSVTGATAAATAYVDIRNEEGLGDDYPALGTGLRAGGLVAVAIQQAETDRGDAALARIVLDLEGGNSVEHAVAIAGHPNADMTSISGPTTPVNLKPGAEHKREITLRDVNGTPVDLPAQDAANDADFSAEDSIRGMITVTETEADPRDLDFAVASKANSPGVYELTITARAAREADDTATPAITAQDAATIGDHVFEVSIDNFDNGDTFKKSDDADGNPLEARVVGGITGLSVTGVANLAGDEILMEGSEVTVGPYDLITITLTATAEDGGAPANDSEVTPLAGTGFVGAGDSAANNLLTDDAGEVTVNYRAGTATQNLGFRAGTAAAQLLVRIVAPGAEADDGPTIYTLAESAGGTFHSWQGGDAASSVFENVANLVRVWWWSGTMWVGYNANPAAPAVTKSAFVLSNNDTLYVVANGEVQLSLD